MRDDISHKTKKTKKKNQRKIFTFAVSFSFSICENFSDKRRIAFSASSARAFKNKKWSIKKIKTNRINSNCVEKEQNMEILGNCVVIKFGNLESGFSIGKFLNIWAFLVKKKEGNV